MGLFTVTSAQEQAPAVNDKAAQEEMFHAIVCVPDTELNPQQIEVLSNSPQANEIRQGFQAFITSPGQMVTAILAQFDDMEKQAKEKIAATYPTEIQQAAEQMAAEQKITVDEAKELILNQEAKKSVASSTKSTPQAEVIKVSQGGCNALKALSALIEKSGCKNVSTGEAIDFTETKNYCETLAPKFEALTNSSQKMGAIQADLQKKMAELQAEAQKTAEPILTEINEIAADAFNTALELAGIKAPTTTAPVVAQP